MSEPTASDDLKVFVPDVQRTVTFLSLMATLAIREGEFGSFGELAELASSLVKILKIMYPDQDHLKATTTIGTEFFENLGVSGPNIPDVYLKAFDVFLKESEE